MAKRFTDSNKWKDTWFQDLPTKYKLFWVYLLDECDAAGIWKPNIRLACFQIGEPFEELELKRVFGDRITITGDGYWFIKKFIEFQYGELSEHSKPHQSVIKILEKHNIKGYAKGIYTLKEKEKEQDKEKDKDEFNDKEITVVLPIEKCKEIALADPRWVKANNAVWQELDKFNEYLERQGTYQINPLDYKKYFSKLKGKYPDLVKMRLTIEDYRRMAREQDELERKLKTA